MLRWLDKRCAAALKAGTCCRRREATLHAAHAGAPGARVHVAIELFLCLGPEQQDLAALAEIWDAPSHLVLPRAELRSVWNAAIAAKQSHRTRAIGLGRDHAAFAETECRRRCPPCCAQARLAESRAAAVREPDEWVKLNKARARGTVEISGGYGTGAGPRFVFVFVSVSVFVSLGLCCTATSHGPSTGRAAALDFSARCPARPSPYYAPCVWVATVYLLHNIQHAQSVRGQGALTLTVP